MTAAALVLQSALSEWSAGDVAQRPGNLRLVVPLMSVNLVCGWLHASFSWKFAVTVVVESLTFSRDSVNRRDVAPLTERSTPTTAATSSSFGTLSTWSLLTMTPWNQAA